MAELKLTATDVQAGDVVRTDEYGWTQWDGEVWRCVGPYVVAPDGEGTLTLWRLPDIHDEPMYVTNKRAMDMESPVLWPALVAHFGANVTSVVIA